MNSEALSAYHFESAEPAHTCAYLWNPVLDLCREFGAKRVLDLGCGNGAFCRRLATEGFAPTGCDPSVEGIDHAVMSSPGLPFELIGVDDDAAGLAGAGEFDAVVSLEVIEHLFFPRRLPQFASRALRPGGRLIISTPYHGYLKDLALAIGNKWETHHSPWWDGGHIKFWTRRALTNLCWSPKNSASRISSARAGVPFLWKSMILAAIKIMKFAFYILGFVLIFFGGLVLMNGKSAIHEIEAFLLFLIAAVFIVGAGIIAKLESR